MYDIKTMLGKEYAELESEAENWPFRVTCNEDGMPQVEGAWQAALRSLLLIRKRC